MMHPCVPAETRILMYHVWIISFLNVFELFALVAPALLSCDPVGARGYCCDDLNAVHARYGSLAGERS
jgi:hypothetical protein